MAKHSRPSLLAPFLDAVPQDDGSAKWKPFVTFHLKSRIQFSLRYEHLLWVILKPGDEIVVRFASHSVRIAGRRLLPLAEALRNLSARDVLELDDRFLVNENTDPVVTRITIGSIQEADEEASRLHAT